MDLSKLATGSKVVLGVGVLLLIDSALHWQEVSFAGFSAGVSMWHGWGILVGLTVLAIIAWELAQIAGIKIAIGPLSPSMVTAALSALLVLFTFLKVLTDDYVAVWAWIGLVLAVGITAGAGMNMRTAGESFADLKSSMADAAASAGAAARTAAASRTDGTSTPAAPDAAAAETSDADSGSGDATA